MTTYVKISGAMSPRDPVATPMPSRIFTQTLPSVQLETYFEIITKHTFGVENGVGML